MHFSAISVIWLFIYYTSVAQTLLVTQIMHFCHKQFLYSFVLQGIFWSIWACLLRVCGSQEISQILT